MKDPSWTRPSSFRVDVVSHGREHLEAALRLALGGQKVVGFAVGLNEEEGRSAGTGDAITLLWHIQDVKAGQATPFPMDADAVVGMMVGWLKQAKYGAEPDFDGSTTKGFRVRSVDKGWSYALCTVTTEWSLFGK